MPPRRLKCSYRERSRRCPREGTGNPPLCPAHRIAFQEASRPKHPSEVVARSLLNFLQGKPINADATLGALDELFGQGSQGIGTGYHPDLRPGESEGATHQRARQGHDPSTWWWRQAQPYPPPPDPRVDARRAEIDARQVLGFSPSEPLTPDLVKMTRRRMAKRYHSDHTGGSDDRMRAINAAADVLLQSLGVSPGTRPAM